MTRRRLVLLAALVLGVAVLAGYAVRTRPSAATFTTSSQSTVTASVDTVSNWLHVYSQSQDPQGQTGYALRRDVNGVAGPPAATGEDGTLLVDLGDFPDRNVQFGFARVFSIRTPDVFPDTTVGQIGVTLTVLPDPTTGDNMLQGQSLTPFGQTKGGAQTVTLGPATKYQFNVSVKARKKFVLGQTYFPRVRLSLTISGVANAFSYEFPLEVTDAGGS